MRRSVEGWNKDYAKGELDHYHALYEIPRHGALAGLLLALGKGQQVLEVGCGDGTFSRHVRAASFTGIDCSEVAIERARRVSPGYTFIVADAETWTPSRKFTSIIFNECLNYFDDPASTVRRHFSFLAGGGVIGASVYLNEYGRKVADQVIACLTVVQHTTLSNSRGSWAVFYGEAR